MSCAGGGESPGWPARVDPWPPQARAVRQRDRSRLPTARCRTAGRRRLLRRRGPAAPTPTARVVRHRTRSQRTGTNAPLTIHTAALSGGYDALLEGVLEYDGTCLTVVNGFDERYLPVFAHVRANWDGEPLAHDGGRTQPGQRITLRAVAGLVALLPTAFRKAVTLILSSTLQPIPEREQGLPASPPLRG